MQCQNERQELAKQQSACIESSCDSVSLLVRYNASSGTRTIGSSSMFIVNVTFTEIIRAGDEKSYRKKGRIIGPAAYLLIEAVYVG